MVNNSKDYADLRAWKELCGVLEMKDLYHPVAREKGFHLWIDPLRASYLIRKYYSKFEEQRKLRLWWVDELAKEMVAGTYQPGDISFHRTPQDSYLTDGQHRLWAVVQSGCTVWFPVNVFWEPDYESVYLAYQRINQGLKRTTLDAAASPNLLRDMDVSKENVKRIGPALKRIASGFRLKWGSEFPWLRGPDAQHSLMRAYGSSGKDYLLSIKGAGGDLANRLRLEDVMSVGVATFMFVTDRRPGEFWSAVAGNDMLRKNSPEQRLVQHLLKEVVKGVPLQRFVAEMWNLWFQKDLRKADRVPEPSSSQPTLLLGTPFDGKSYWVLDEETLNLVRYSSRPRLVLPDLLLGDD